LLSLSLAFSLPLSVTGWGGEKYVILHVKRRGGCSREIIGFGGSASNEGGEESSECYELRGSRSCFVQQCLYSKSTGESA